ncbi:MAG TPA: VOC family protein [Nocardioidaceae bacterium]|nr:VOC family protein [Nocardioidaceae bacterium]
MTVSVRYIVNDTADLTAYELLGFEVLMHPGPGFAMLGRGEARLLLNVPGGGGGAGQTTSSGQTPAPGGWNRIQVEVDDVEAVVRRLSDAGVRTRGDVIEGRGGRQAIVEDASGNPIELFEPPSGG